MNPTICALIVISLIGMGIYHSVLEKRRLTNILFIHIKKVLADEEYSTNVFHVCHDTTRHSPTLVMSARVDIFTLYTYIIKILSQHDISLIGMMIADGEYILMLKKESTERKFTLELFETTSLRNKKSKSVIRNYWLTVA